MALRAVQSPLMRGHPSAVGGTFQMLGRWVERSKPCRCRRRGGVPTTQHQQSTLNEAQFLFLPSPSPNSFFLYLLSCTHPPTSHGHHLFRLAWRARHPLGEGGLDTNSQIFHLQAARQTVPVRSVMVVPGSSRRHRHWPGIEGKVWCVVQSNQQTNLRIYCSFCSVSVVPKELFKPKH